MPHGSKGSKARAFFSRLLGGQGIGRERETRFTPNGAEGGRGLGGGFFPNAQNFTMYHPTMNYNVQGENDRIIQAMKLLSKQIIPGAAHDSSAREPPPRCHPGTRIKLNGRITTWFHDKKRQNALLWVNGPAGVGKSAVIQTFAESIVASKRLGASVFFSRPNKRNDPHRVFITIAYQLAVRIEAYRTFIAERLALDPDLLNKGMKEQFRIFIVEPFAERKIEAGGDAWCILLDGLDELAEQGPQRDIIRLISAFVLEHPDAPLVWTIASRPEPHISDTFGEEETAPSYWQEYIPIDSTEACEDVERFLRASFKAIQKEFPRSVPKDWPSEGAFLRLASAASGLFVFAAVAIRFIGDVNFASPVSRFELVLSTIEGSKVVAPEEQPFAHLDALYTQILISIPQASWLTAKRLLGFVLCSRGRGLASRNLKGMSVVLNLEQDVIYASLNKCYSILEIPPPKHAYSKPVTFFHASFADYLTDSTRSKDFHISLDDAGTDVANCIFHIMQDFVSKEPPRRSETIPMWTKYCSQYHSRAPKQRSGKMQMTFARDLFNDGCEILSRMPPKTLESAEERGGSVSQQDLFEYLEVLGQMDIVDLPCRTAFLNLLPVIWEEHSEELVNKGLIREIGLEELTLRHLDCERMRAGRFSDGGREFIPRSSTELGAFLSELESLQRERPKLKLFICGSRPEIRNVLFCSVNNDSESFFIPYTY